MRRFLSALVLALGAVALGVAPAGAQGPGRKVQVELVPEHQAVPPGGTVTVALHQKIEKGWHTYWRNPGDSGAATEILWQLPPGWKAGEIQWPYPARVPTGPLVNFGYEDEVALLVEVTAPADAAAGQTVTLPAKVKWLVCSDICIPEEADLSLPLAIGPAAGAASPIVTKARETLPRPAPFEARYQADGTRFSLLAQSPELATARPREAVFFPASDGFVKAAAPQRVRSSGEGLIIDSEPGAQFTGAAPAAAGTTVEGVLVLTAANGAREAFALSAAPGTVPPPPLAANMGVLQAVLFAFLGGLILNLMPCVLPVLSMKALALAGHPSWPGAPRREALAYAGGVLVTFLLLGGAMLALRSAGSAAGWGFQLQQPVFVAALALLMFAVGLNLSGLFEIGGGRLAGAGQNLTARGGTLGSFFTGTLAVLVATPCTAPFMAAALGYAVTQSAAVALAVFAGLALGFAAPFVALGFSPWLLRHVPRPGTWMIIFRQVLAFPMYGAAIWLVWVPSQQAGPDGLLMTLAAALALAFGLWAYGAASRSNGRGQTIGLTAAAISLLAVFALTARIATSSPAPALAAAESGGLTYEPYSAARLASLRAEGKPVFVNATAAWCITCLVNERVALSRDDVQKAFADAGVVALKADWTNQNPEITALLGEYGRSGVPLYLYYAPQSAAAKVLPQILTQTGVLSVLQAGT